MTTLQGLEFDPGFAPYILAFQSALEYFYADINKFKNLSQRKTKFRQYYKKILEVYKNNLGFYLGCLMWAEYVKTQPEQEILNNTCFGQKFSDEENTYEIDYMIRFVTLFPKDMKYFLGENFQFPNSHIKILNLYKEFLVLNNGFVSSKTNTDIIIPDGLKSENALDFKDKIDDVLRQKDLSQLLKYEDLLL